MPSTTVDRPAWYLKPECMRKPRHHAWTPDELKTVYTMRLMGMPVRDIRAQLQNMGSIQVYNMTRLMRKKELGRCSLCGNPLSETDKVLEQTRRWKRCPKCRDQQADYKRNYRIRQLNKGLCSTGCGRKVIPGRTYCRKCISLLQRRRYTDGLCGACGKNPIAENSIAFCKYCLERNKKNSARYYRTQKKEVL